MKNIKSIKSIEVKIFENKMVVFATKIAHKKLYKIFLSEIFVSGEKNFLEFFFHFKHFFFISNQRTSFAFFNKSLSF